MSTTTADPLLETWSTTSGGTTTSPWTCSTSTGATGAPSTRAGASTSIRRSEWRPPPEPPGRRTDASRRRPRARSSASDPRGSRSRREVEGGRPSRDPARRHRAAHPRRRAAHRREHGGEPPGPDRHLGARRFPCARSRRTAGSSTSTATSLGQQQGQLHPPRGLGDPARPRHLPAPERRLRGARGPGPPHPARRGAARASPWTCRRRTARARCSSPTSRTRASSTSRRS